RAVVESAAVASVEGAEVRELARGVRVCSREYSLLERTPASVCVGTEAPPPTAAGARHRCGPRCQVSCRMNHLAIFRVSVRSARTPPHTSRKRHHPEPTWTRPVRNPLPSRHRIPPYRRPVVSRGLRTASVSGFPRRPTAQAFPPSGTIHHHRPLLP